MKDYPVIIIETLEKTVHVHAESAEQAREIAEQKWKNGDYILDADNFTGAKFTTPARSERER